MRMRVVGLAVLVLSVAGALAQARVEVILRAGDPAPGVDPAKTIRDLDLPHIDDAGEVAFFGWFQPGFSVGLWVTREGELDTIAYQGMQAPGFEPDGTLSSLGAGSSILGMSYTKAGHATFPARVNRPWPEYSPPGLWSTVSGSLAPLLLQNQPVPGLEEGAVIISLNYWHDSPVTSAGEFVVRIHTDAPHLSDPLLYVHRDGQLTLLARAGHAAPSLPDQIISSFERSAISTNGRVAFQAGLTGGGQAIYSEGPGALTVIAKRHDQVPGLADGITFAAFEWRGPAINAAGHTLFAATLGGNATNADNAGLWYHDGQTLHTLARRGDAAPGTEPGTVFGAFHDRVLNNAGDVAVAASLIGSDVTGVNDLGIWRGTPDNLQLLIREGQTVTVNGVDSLMHTIGHEIAMNDRGLVLFSAFERAYGPGYTLLLTDGIDVVPVTIPPGYSTGNGWSMVRADFEAVWTTNNLASPLNDFGQVAYRVAHPVTPQTNIAIARFTPDLHWRGTAGNNLWDDPLNWTLSIKPAEMHDVYFDPDEDVAMFLGYAVKPTVRSLTVGGGAGQATLVTQVHRVITVEESLRILDRGFIQAASNIVGDVIQSGGKLALYRSLLIDGDFTITDGILATRVYSASSPSVLHTHNRYIITGTATLGGTLEIELVNGVKPLLGMTYHFLSANTIIDTFEDLAPIVFDGRTFALRYEPDAVWLDVIPLLAGDANNDGIVDAADFVAVERNLGATGVTNGSLPGDANDDGRVDGDDWLFVERHFGAAWSAPLSTPEPGTGAGLVVLMTLALNRKRGRGRGR